MDEYWKNRGGGRLFGLDRVEEKVFARERAERLERELTAGTNKEICYDAADKRWYLREREDGETSKFVETFCREYENKRLRKMRLQSRQKRQYREIEWISDLYGFVWYVRDCIEEQEEGEWKRT